MHRKLMGKSIRWKVQGINMLTMLLTVLLSCIIAYKAIVLPNRRSLQISVANSLAYSADTLAHSLETAQTLSNLLYSDNVIQTQLTNLNKIEGESISLRAKSSISNILLKYTEQYASLKIKYINLVSESFSYSTNDSISNAETLETKEMLLSLADNGDGALMVYIRPGEKSTLYLTRLIRQIKGFTLEHLGYITICMDMNALSEEATSFASTFGDTDFLLMRDDVILYKSKGLKDISNEIFDHFSEDENDYNVIKINEKRFFCVGGKFSYRALGTRESGRWQYYSMVPYDNVMRETRQSYELFALLSLALAVFSWVLSSCLMHPVFQELTYLVQRMKCFYGTNPPEIESAYSLRNDEIAELHRQFENMGQRIALLIQENYEKELVQKATELHALMMQVNPHFLYNVLETINWRAQNVGLTSVCEMSSALGNLLRETIGDMRQQVSLQEELSLIDHFVQIQKIRFEEQLEYRTEIDAALDDVLVPKMIIQPLVDNAIRYGLEMQLEGPCRVSLIIRRKDETKVEINVMNTGSSFEDNLLESLHNHDLEPRGTGIGLLNIDKRMQLLYGKEYRMVFFNENGLAIAQIVLPIRYQKEKTNVETNDC